MQNQRKEFGYLSSSILISVFRGLLVGLFSGFMVSAFRYLIGLLFGQFQRAYRLSHQLPWILIVILSIYLIYSYIIGRLIVTEPDIKGSGIPQVEAELKGLMSQRWWSVLWKKFLAGVLGISSGLMLGREGPSIQVGAVSGKGIARYLNLSKLEERTLIASGAAAGVSAAFNAPIAGLLFVVEEVYHHFSSRVWITALSASLTANLISLRVFGQTPVLAMPSQLPLPRLSSYGLFILLGFFLGFLSYHYEKVILKMADYYAALGKWLHLKSHYYSLVAFVLTLPLGYFAPWLLGGGNALVRSLSTMQAPILLFLVLFVLRFFYSMMSYGSGLPGGIFLPILTLGACLGAFFGRIFLELGWITSGEFPLIIILGMSAYFGAISKAPLTAMILVCEMVGDLRHLMALGTVTLVAYIVMDMLGGAPVYEAMLEKLFEGKQPDADDSPLTWIELPVSSKIAGKAVYQLELPKDVLITSQRENGKSHIVSGSTKLILGNAINIVLPEDKIDQIRHLLLD
ncbi:chloride channel protein [Streptococcus dentasini]